MGLQGTRRVLATLAMIWAGSAIAQTPSDLSITIYANNLALVRDTRNLDLAQGRQRLEFKGVSAEIRPETVSLAAPGVSVIEQNFDFDLLSPAKMMEKAVGHMVTIVRTNPATGAESSLQAEVLAVNNGVVLKIGDRIEVLRDDGLPTRVIFDKIPDNLRAQPTLSVIVDAAQTGARPVTLSYLTPGLGWRADYVALFDEAAGKIDVQGWVTLTNASGVTYDHAETVLVAGTPNIAGPGDDGPRGGMESAGTERGTRARLGDFYLYPLPERTTIANQQTKQVSFLDVRGAPATHGYEMRLGWMQTLEEPQSVRSVYRFSNSAKGGLGDQLPAGIVRFYVNDAKGSPQFIGESPIGHTPMGSELSLSTGDAFDVKVKSVVEDRKKEGASRWRTSMRYTLTNALSAPVTVRLIQDGLWGDTKIVAESLASRRASVEEAEWSVSVPAEGKTEVTASFDSKY
jgi:hypothetical protein